MKHLIVTVTLLLAGISMPAYAQFAKAEDAIKYRQKCAVCHGAAFHPSCRYGPRKNPF